MTNKKRINPKGKIYNAEQKRAIIDIIDKGLALFASEAHITTELIENKVVKLSLAACKALIAARKRKLAISKTKLITEEELNRGLAVLRLECIYATAFQRGDYKTALAATKELAEIHGVYIASKPSKVVKTVTNNTQNVLHITEDVVNSLDQFSDEQLKAALDQQEISPAQAQYLIDRREGKQPDEET